MTSHAILALRKMVTEAETQAEPFLSAVELEGIKLALTLIEAPPEPPPPTIERSGREVRFFVDGVPAPQGSKVPGRRNDGTLYVRDDNPAKLAEWRRRVRDVGLVNRATFLRQVPLAVGLSFTMPHTERTRGTVAWCPVKPDLDKLERAVFDALKDGKVLTDDSQIVKVAAAKRYGDRPGVMVIVRDAGAVYDPKQALASDQQE